MPILDASILDSDPEGARRLREVLGPPRRQPVGQEAMRAAADGRRRGRRRDEQGGERRSEDALAHALDKGDTNDPIARRYQPLW